MTHSDVVEQARSYYNSDDAEHFYSKIWGGEDIHIGIYKSADESIYEASRRSVKRMANGLGDLPKSAHVLDIGSGYCGAARYIASRYGCQVTALNLSQVENERAQALNTEQGLAKQIEIVEGNFEDIPSPDASFDVVWSQDAILHSGNRAKVVQEVARVLKPNGQFVFSDIMQSDSCPPGVLTPILKRIHLETLGSETFYTKAGQTHGLSLGSFEPLTKHLVTHYSKVLSETERQEPELAQSVDGQYIANMKKGLEHWIQGGKDGHLVWGIFQFVKS